MSGAARGAGGVSDAARRRWRVTAAVAVGWCGAGTLLAVLLVAAAVFDGFRSTGPAWWRAVALTGGTVLVALLGVRVVRRRLRLAGRASQVKMGSEVTHPAAAALRNADLWRAVVAPTLVVPLLPLGPASGPARERWAAGDLSLPDGSAADVAGTGLLVAVVLGIVVIALVAVRRNEARALALALEAGPELPEAVVRRLLAAAPEPLRGTALVSYVAGALALLAALVAPSDPGPAAAAAAVALGVQVWAVRGRTTALAAADADRDALRLRFPDAG